MILLMFDVDGTLIDSNNCDSICFENAVKKVLKLNSFNTDWSSYKHATDINILNEIISEHKNRESTHNEIQEILSEFLANLRNYFSYNKDNIIEIHGAKSFLSELIEKNQIAVSIATGCFQKSAKLKLENSGISIKNIPFASSNDAISREEIMKASELKAKNYYNVNQFKSIFYLGDALWDLTASRNLEYNFIGVGSNIEKLKLAGAKFVVPDYKNKTLLYDYIVK